MIFISMKMLAAAGFVMLLSAAWFVWTVSNAPLLDDDDV
jgi:hypothetical protein